MQGDRALSALGLEQPEAPAPRARGDGCDDNDAADELSRPLDGPDRGERRG